MEGFSKYFTFENMTKSDRYPAIVEKNRQEAMEFIDNGRRLSKLMEKIRLFLGAPMKETSGFRGKTLTKAGKFSTTSTHTRFEALDSVPIGMTVDEAFDKIKESVHLFCGLRRVIKEKKGGKEWLHIEARASCDEPQVFAIMTDDIQYKEVWRG